MNWQALADLVVTLLERFEETEPPELSGTPKEVVRKLSALEAKTSERVDDIIRQLAKGKPVVNDSVERYFLSERLRLAHPIAQALKTGQAGDKKAFVPVPAQADPESMLAWLLIDVWRSTTRNVWLGPFLDTSKAIDESGADL